MNAAVTPEEQEAARARLEAQVARLKQREAERKAAATLGPVVPDAEAGEAMERLLQGARASGIRILSTVEVEELNRQQNEASRLAHWHGIVPAVYSEPFDFSKAKGRHSEIRKVLDWKYGPRGLYIIGKTGSSKSRAVANALKPYFMAGGTVCYLSGVEFSEQCTAVTLEGKGLAKWKLRLCRVGVLWIDDLGKRWTKATEEECFSIVEDRTSRGRPIIFTTNYDKFDMQSKQHDAQIMEPLLRRVRDYTEMLDFDEHPAADDVEFTQPVKV